MKDKDRAEPSVQVDDLEEAALHIASDLIEAGTGGPHYAKARAYAAKRLNTKEENHELWGRVFTHVERLWHLHRLSD